MYSHYFGFARSPFKITPDPELFFPGGNRGAVLDALVYAVGRGEGIVKVVGEVGSGKTMLCRMLERELPTDCEIIYLANPNLGADEILHAIAFELRLDVAPGMSKPALTRQLHDYLLGKHADNRRVVMFVEEAQAMPVATLEEIRLLSNLETAHDKLLQIVLFGQPELDHKLAMHEIRQLNERITHRFTLHPFGPLEIRDYVNSRLRASGYRGPELFTRGAVRALARRSHGLLRRINILADKALLAAYSSGARSVRGWHVGLAARDSGFSTTYRRWWRWAAGAGALLVVSGAVTWHFAARIPGLNLHATTIGPAAPAVRYTELATLSAVLATSDPISRDDMLDPYPEASVFERLDRLGGGSEPVLTLNTQPSRP
jgi:MSHA biogenesis protein MshM